MIDKDKIDKLKMTNEELSLVENFKKIFYNEKIDILLEDENYDSILIGFLVAKNVTPERAFEIASLITI